jgi:osmotically-inducible protein OsmY
VKTIGLAAAGALALLAGACSHEQGAVGNESAWQRSKEDFASAYDDVKSGVERTAIAGRYALADAGRGIVHVTDVTKEGLQRGGETVADSWITTKLVSEYAVDKGVKASQVRVKTRDGVVRLTGTVDSPQEAERAIQIALKTKGVVAVDAALQYPTRERPARIYTAPPR